MINKLYHFTNMTSINTGSVLNPGTHNEFGVGVYFSTTMCAEYARISKNNNAICIVINNDSTFKNVQGRPYVHSNGQSIQINAIDIKKVDLTDPRAKNNDIYRTLIAKGAKRLVVITVTDYSLINNVAVAA